MTAEARDGYNIFTFDFVGDEGAKGTKCDFPGCGRQMYYGTASEDYEIGLYHCEEHSDWAEGECRQRIASGLAKPIEKGPPVTLTRRQ